MSLKFRVFLGIKTKSYYEDIFVPSFVIIMIRYILPWYYLTNEACLLLL